MSTPEQTTVANAPIAGWRNYLELCKPRVVVLIVFTAIVGMFLAAPGMVPASALFWGSIGIGLAAASGAAVNHVVDQRIDGLMARTRRRPLPTGAIDVLPALLFAIALCVFSAVSLGLFVNGLTAALAVASMVGYSVIYTMFLKRATPQNIVIGGAAGAMPPVLGWTAVTGSIDPNAWLLFLIIFAWTPPHFWALAIHRQKEYAKADIPMLPVTHGLAFTRLQVLLYTVVLTLVTLLPFITRMSGLLYLLGTLVLDGVFLYYAITLYLGKDKKIPMKTFNYSIVYLMGLFSLLLADHYLLLF